VEFIMKTKTKNFLASLAVGLALTTSTAALAADYDHDGRRDNSWAERHDYDGYRDNRRFDRRVTRAIINHDRVYEVVRAHRYRYIGAPYWYRGYYGVRAYDPYGKVVFVRVDPYRGNWLGVAFRF
jgi:hypothetical protein